MVAQVVWEVVGGGVEGGGRWCGRRPEPEGLFKLMGLAHKNRIKNMKLTESALKPISGTTRLISIESQPKKTVFVVVVVLVLVAVLLLLFFIFILVGHVGLANHLALVVVSVIFNCHRNLTLEFGQNWVNN